VIWSKPKRLFSRERIQRLKKKQEIFFQKKLFYSKYSHQNFLNESEKKNLCGPKFCENSPQKNFRGKNDTQQTLKFFLRNILCRFVWKKAIWEKNESYPPRDEFFPAGVFIWVMLPSYVFGKIYLKVNFREMERDYSWE